MQENKDDLNDVRFLGSISAGYPLPVDDYKEQKLDLNELVAPHPISTYYMQVAGDSMIGACIHQGDLIVVDRSVTAAHKKIIVARLGDKYTLKRLWNMYPKMYLRPENPKYQPIEVTNDLRFVQLTPPGSACSIVIGVGITDMQPESLKGLQMVVSDVKEVRDELVKRGVAVSEIEVMPWGSFAYFSDPDGNSWSLQQLPVRN